MFRSVFLLGLLAGSLVPAFAETDGVSPATSSLRIGLNVVWDGRGGTGEITDATLGQRLLKDVLDASATVVRIGVSWASIEEQRGQYNWVPTDHLVELLVSQGIEPLACFCTTPFWASDLTDAQRAPFIERKWEGLLGVVPPSREHTAAFRRYARACAERYRGKIRLYEFWNEEEGMGMPIPVQQEDGSWDIRLGGDPEVYAYWLKEAHDALKAGNPEAQVAIGGMERWKENRFFRGLLEQDVKGSFDAVALHPYGTGDTENALDWAWVRDTVQVLDEQGLTHIPLWLTEWGWHLSDKEGGIDEQRQALLIERAVQQARQHPRVTLMTLHTLNDWGGSVHSSAKMGLVDLLGRRRPAFEAFAREARRLSP